VDVVFTGADHGIERGVEQDYQRGLSGRRTGSGGGRRVGDERPDVAAAARLPAAAGGAGWYGMASVKWLRSIEVIDHEFHRIPERGRLRLRREDGEPGEPISRIEPRRC